MRVQQALLVACMLTLATTARGHHAVSPNPWPASALCTTKVAAGTINATPRPH